MARENSAWGYDRIAGALDNVGYRVSDQTVGNILRRFGIAPAPKRRMQMSWADFVRSHMAVLAGMDFFTVEVLTWRGLKTYYVLFFLHPETRRVTIAGITTHPTEQWLTQVARNAVDEIDGVFRPIRFALHDRDSKFCASFRATLRSGGGPCSRLSPTVPSSSHAMPRTLRWIAQVLQPCCMNNWFFLTFGAG
jgi:putative transposase